MPLSGVWSGRGGDAYFTRELVFHFPGDKKERDPTHARLAKKIAAREAQKAQSAGSAGAPAN